MKKILFVLCLTALAITVKAAKVDTVETYSDAMRKKIKAVVVTPDNYSSGKQYPVVYLLHGASGNYSDWVKKGGKGVAENADLYNVILVCPDGGNTSWYWDSPIDPAYKYETYVIMS